MARRFRRLTITALAGALLFGSGAPTSGAASGGAGGGEGDATLASLPAVGSGARPGPPVLYDSRPAAPSLENHHPAFVAEPILVAGSDAYERGEYLYQDHIYDDYGADTGANDSATTDSTGDVMYPTDVSRFGGNAADIVELRVSLRDPDVVAYRITLNTLLDAAVPALALAFDTDHDPATGSATLPADPGLPVPGTDAVLSVLAGSATWHEIVDGGWSARTIDADIDTGTNQVTVLVPRSLADPAGAWRATLLAGVSAGPAGWARPGAAPTATTPGGAGPLDPRPAGVFNVGFRFTEPVTIRNTPPDALQAPAVARKDVSTFARTIDFDKLARREVDRSNVPTTGTIVRIFPSRLTFPPGEGRDHAARPEYRGQLQPYSLYVPTTYPDDRRAGFTLNLHSLGEYHYQYNGSIGVQQLGEQRFSLVATPAGRGENGWYRNEAEYDVFEVWNDVARHYRLDPDRAWSAGYSMGGYGTYRLATLYPDLFAAAFTTVGPACEGIWVPPGTCNDDTNTNRWLENARNVPFLNVTGALDELVPLPGPRAQNVGAPEVGVRGFEQLGYRYRYVVYPTADHFALALRSYDIPYAVDFFDSFPAVERNPRRVTYSRVPGTEAPALGLVHDHAYWVSEVAVAGGATKGTVDATSLARTEGEPLSVAGATTGVAPAGFAYAETNRIWPEVADNDPRNALRVDLQAVEAVAFDLRRAGLDVGRPLTVHLRTTVPTTVHLDGFERGAVVVDGETVPVERGGVSVRVAAGDHTIDVSPR